MSKAGTDSRDIRHGAYDPVSKDGLPQAVQVKDKTTPHQKEQVGADVRAEPLPGTEPVLPEGLVRPPHGPLRLKQISLQHESNNSRRRRPRRWRGRPTGSVLACSPPH